MATCRKYMRKVVSYKTSTRVIPILSLNTVDIAFKTSTVSLNRTCHDVYG